MKQSDFLDGISSIESDVVDRFVAMDNRLQKNAVKSKPKVVWPRFAAVAASFLLVVSAIVAAPMLQGDDPVAVVPPDSSSSESEPTGLPVATPTPGSANDDPVVTSSPKPTATPTVAPSIYKPILLDATASPEQLTGSNLNFVVGSSLSTLTGISSAPPEFEFDLGISVKAKVVKNYPDTYHKLGTGSESTPGAYRLIELETLEVIVGENIPHRFLYLIPAYYYVDMTVYDSLIISMKQLGIENYVIKNVTKNQMEAMELLIFSDYHDQPVLGNVIAFSGGVFDESLWETKSWFYGYQFARRKLENPDFNDLVVARGMTERGVIDNIKARAKDLNPSGYRKATAFTPDFKTQEAIDAMDFVKPFANGVFSQSYEPYAGNGLLIFTRYINGCETEEVITVDIVTEEVTYSEVRYTVADMRRMENISAHVAEMAAEYAAKSPTPPHIDPKGKELMCLNLYAWYVKKGDRLYGVIKTAWRYQKEGDRYTQYYDEAYRLFDMSTGTALNMPRDTLVNIVGDRNVYTKEFGEAIPMPM